MTVGTKSTEDEEEADLSYHTEKFYRWHMDQLDPSIALVSLIFLFGLFFFVKLLVTENSRIISINGVVQAALRIVFRSSAKLNFEL